MVASEVCARDSFGAGGGSKLGGDKDGGDKSKSSLREKTSSNHITKALKDAFESTANAVVQMQEALQVIRSLEKPEASVRGVAQRLKGQSRDIRKLHRRLDVLEQKTGVSALPAPAPAPAPRRAHRLHRADYATPTHSSSPSPSPSPSPTPTPDPWELQGGGASCTMVRFLSPPRKAAAPAAADRRGVRRVAVEFAASTPALPPATPAAASVARDNAHLEALGKKLLKAAHDGRVADVHRLLSAGAAADFCGRGAWTATHRAAARAHAAVLQLLLARGARVDPRDCYGFTPLHMAAYNDASARCVAALLDAGARVQLRDHAGRTALHSAAEGGNGACVLALMAAGACTTATDDKGRTPYDVAKTDVIRRLLAPY